MDFGECLEMYQIGECGYDELSLKSQVTHRKFSVLAQDNTSVLETLQRAMAYTNTKLTHFPTKVSDENHSYIFSVLGQYSLLTQLHPDDHGTAVELCKIKSYLQSDTGSKLTIRQLISFSCQPRLLLAQYNYCHIRAIEFAMC
ncbi:hypothetical protein THRCLA_20919 [Thraustotheca clavata]|uniref:Uncharacterized protein n=1 Tax=Thraustotheca clavata TaxID=74557 RepID=A0A1W0A1Z4_9STRA|nr:hypothetical protein THRCLA_20919 [Thraustotheca clavata]